MKAKSSNLRKRKLSSTKPRPKSTVSKGRKALLAKPKSKKVPSRPIKVQKVESLKTSLSPSSPSKKRKTCLQLRCRHQAVVEDYCRAHYIENWKKIREGRQVTVERRLHSYVSRLLRTLTSTELGVLQAGLLDPLLFRKTIDAFDFGDSDPQVDTDSLLEEDFIDEFTKHLKIGNE